MTDIYYQDPEFQMFREGLKQREAQLERRVAEMEDRDEELVRAITRNNELEALLKAREDELELSQGVIMMAENADLQLKVADLNVEMNAKIEEIGGLKGELNAIVDKLAAAISETVSLEDALYMSRSELTREREASGSQVAELKRRIGELGAELSLLQRQVAPPRAGEIYRRPRPSTSRPLAGQGSTRCLF
ncbi:uncharacterized protein [Nicotiana sylvestris]|uniref:uncharacterized protein n=1 Tax=Nicotiana sylvestris TaxID=4096 RepID=UPI00388CACB2